jgi:hypothetical protein
VIILPAVGAFIYQNAYAKDHSNYADGSTMDFFPQSYTDAAVPIAELAASITRTSASLGELAATGEHAGASLTQVGSGAAAAARALENFAARVGSISLPTTIGNASAVSAPTGGMHAPHG